LNDVLVHGTTLDIAGCGVLLLGEPGAGKSDLALRLIADGALLVADDQTVVEIVDAALHASAPSPIAGLIEMRGVGIVRAPVKRATLIRLAVQLVATAPERMPERRTWSLPNAAQPSVPLVELTPFEASLPAKLRATLAFVPNA
jgi:serine kinase of HPr protein (carbohydrate metabolism regulator)